MCFIKKKTGKILIFNEFYIKDFKINQLHYLPVEKFCPLSKNVKIYSNFILYNS